MHFRFLYFTSDPRVGTGAGGRGRPRCAPSRPPPQPFLLPAGLRGPWGAPQAEPPPHGPGPRSPFYFCTLCKSLFIQNLRVWALTLAPGTVGYGTAQPRALCAGSPCTHHARVCTPGVLHAHTLRAGGSSGHALPGGGGRGCAGGVWASCTGGGRWGWAGGAQGVHGVGAAGVHGAACAQCVCVCGVCAGGVCAVHCVCKVRAPCKVWALCVQGVQCVCAMHTVCQGCTL